MAEVVAGADVLVMGVPSHSFRSVLKEARSHLRPWVPVISLTKGLELASGKRMTERIEEVLPGHPIGVRTGPNLARGIRTGPDRKSCVGARGVYGPVELGVRRLVKQKNKKSTKK